MSVFDTLQTVPTSLFAADRIPLFSLDTFPWQAVEKALATLFPKHQISLTHKETQWRDANTLWSDFTPSPRLFTFNISPFQGTCALAFAPEVPSFLLETLLGDNTWEKDFEKSFFWFLGGEIARILSNLPLEENQQWLFSLREEETPPTQNSLCCDFILTLNQKGILFRSIITETLQKSFLKDQHPEYFQRLIKRKVANRISIPICIEGGTISLPPSTWSKIQIGDLIFLDKAPAFREKGRVRLTTFGTTLFRGMLKEEGIKILENPLEDFKSETPMLETTDNNDTPPLPEHEQSPQKNTPPTETPPKQTSIEEIPLEISIELARLSMPIQKLLSLQPGNMLEIDVSSQCGVDLVVNQKKIARGEVIRIGDKVGVRIVEI